MRATVRWSERSGGAGWPPARVWITAQTHPYLSMKTLFTVPGSRLARLAPLALLLLGAASVHAQRFEQMAKRQDVIAQVFADPVGAGTTARERAIVDFSIALTAQPDQISADSVEALRAVGLDDLEILDLIHSVAIFAWANRLMLNLGEPVFPA